MNAEANGLEIVVVPDFSGESARMFEARVMFFLASWLEWFGEDADGQCKPEARLCCVGEPPDSVWRLAERAKAKISVHAPVAGFWGGFANKLRGLEGIEQGKRRLVLDADVLILGDISDLRETDANFAAAAAGKPQVPQALWERLYAELGVTLPEERISSVRGKFGLGFQNVSIQYAGQQEEADAMLPYYNSGVLLVRGNKGLRARWEEHMHRILHLATADPQMAKLHALTYGDQVGLATALQSLRAEGCIFALLPDYYNARLAHVRAAALRWQSIRLFHATGFLRGLQAHKDLPTLLERYASRWSEAIMEGSQRSSEMADDVQEPYRFLQTLWTKWVRPAWEQSGSSL